ncbi:unnamed protein product [Amoebophrya sp. A25]|nr:unnamed protein product [Amoebophrya sp. A25]|eukprot:GSA25T00018177001.1
MVAAQTEQAPGGPTGRKSMFEDAALQIAEDSIGTLNLDSVGDMLVSVTQDLQDFIDSVNWRSDGWLFLLIGTTLLQYLVWIFVLSLSPQSCFLLFGCNAVFCAVILPIANTWLAENWKLVGFSAQYFDENGFFATSFIGVPLLLANILLLCKITKHTFSLAVKVKRKQLGISRTTTSSETEATDVGKTATL